MTSPLSATPWGIPGGAIVNEIDGKPSICVPEQARESVAVHSISVSESQLHKGERLTMWQVELEPEVTPALLRPGDCITYGEKLPGYKQLVSARFLQVAVDYYARINLVVANPTRQSIIFYDAVFCVGQKIGGGLHYHQYKYERDGKVVKPACGDDFGGVSPH
ncbi:hypothetical protein D3C85_1364750 [compost metagenome]